MTPYNRKRLVGTLKAIGTLYVLCFLWIHFPSLFKSFLGGSKRIELDLGNPGFVFIERGWFFGSITRIRYLQVQDQEFGGYKWISRLEVQNGTPIRAGNENGIWEDVLPEETDEYLHNPLIFKLR